MEHSVLQCASRYLIDFCCLSRIVGRGVNKGSRSICDHQQMGIAKLLATRHARGRLLLRLSVLSELGQGCGQVTLGVGGERVRSQPCQRSRCKRLERTFQLVVGCRSRMRTSSKCEEHWTRD